jgi:hypothetical protein
MDVVADTDARPSPASVRMVSTAAARGIKVETLAVPGEPFWATPEIADVPALVNVTMDFFA